MDIAEKRDLMVVEDVTLGTRIFKIANRYDEILIGRIDRVKSLVVQIY